MNYYSLLEREDKEVRVYKQEPKSIYLMVHGEYHSPLILKEKPKKQENKTESIDDIVKPSEKQLLNRELLVEDHPHYLENKDLLKDYPDLMQKNFNMYELKITKEKNGDYQVQSLSSPRSVYETFKQRAEQQDREELLAIFVNTKNELIGYQQVAVGTLSYVVTSPREIIKSAILANAASILLMHNHPSGDPTPSKEDIELTNIIKNACKLMDIPFLDHVIIGDNGRYTSLRQLGKI